MLHIVTLGHLFVSSAAGMWHMAKRQRHFARGSKPPLAQHEGGQRFFPKCAFLWEALVPAFVFLAIHRAAYLFNLVLPHKTVFLRRVIKKSRPGVTTFVFTFPWTCVSPQPLPLESTPLLSTSLPCELNDYHTLYPCVSARSREIYYP